MCRESLKNLTLFAAKSHLNDNISLGLPYFCFLAIKASQTTWHTISSISGTFYENQFQIT